jgi:hypothetical protein
MWIDAGWFENALRESCGPHDSRMHDVVFHFPVGCKIMIDGAIRLLSLTNQLVLSTRRVRLDFQEGEDGTMGYLNRMEFFDHLAPAVEVLPSRPGHSSARLRRGGNSMLVEIARINKDDQAPDLPKRLSDAISCACSSRPDVDEPTGAAWTKVPINSR